MTAVPGPAEQTRQTAVTAVPPARRPVATYALAAIVAGAACLIFAATALVIAAARASGLSLGYGGSARFLLLVAAVVAATGLAAAVAIAVMARRSLSRGSGGAPSVPPTGDHSHRAPLLWTAGGVAVCSAAVFVLIWGTGLGQSERDLLLYAAEAAAAIGLIVAAVLVVRAVWPGRPTSLRTRAFFVIAVAVLIPSFCLAMLGVWAYYRSWDTATSLYSGQASYQASELAGEIASVQNQRDRFGPNERARLAAAIAAAYGTQGHFEGAQLATLSQLRETRTLPVWALRSLARQGYAIGGQHVQPGSPDADIVAWRVGPHIVRYYVPQWTGGSFSAPMTSAPSSGLTVPSPMPSA